MTGAAPAIPDRLDRARLGGWVGIALAAPYVLVLGGTISLLALPQPRVFQHALILVTCLIGLVAAARQPTLLRSRVVVAGTAFVAAGVASALVSQRPAASTEAAALLVVSAPCYLAIRADWPLVVCAFLVLTPYVLRVLVAWLAWWAAPRA